MPTVVDRGCVRAPRRPPCTGRRGAPHTVPFVARPRETPRPARPVKRPSGPSQALRGHLSVSIVLKISSQEPPAGPRRPVARRRPAGQRRAARGARLSGVTPTRCRLCRNQPVSRVPSESGAFSRRWPSRGRQKRTATPSSRRRINGVQSTVKAPRKFDLCTDSRPTPARPSF